jgi:SAM-dependent methyltransferase
MSETKNETKNIVQSLRRLVPMKIRARLREAPGVQRLLDTAVIQRLLDPNWERSRARWRETKPDPGLTWGQELTGEAFVSKVESYASFDDETTVLEIGPGYGRILRSFLARGIPFKEYYGLDISEQNVEYLRKLFPQATVHFIQADIEVASFPFQFDVGFSSLVFKHLYPSFEAALRNCSRYMSPHGRLIFDLIEGDQRRWNPYGDTYVRRYRRDEVLEILGKVGLELVAFDEVVHDPKHRRLLVVATKPN